MSRSCCRIVIDLWQRVMGGIAAYPANRDIGRRERLSLSLGTRGLVPQEDARAAAMCHKESMTTPRLPRDELTAAVAARQELGSEYDDAFVETIVERIEESLAARTAARTRPQAAPAPRQKGGGKEFALAIISIGAIPIGAGVTMANHGNVVSLFLVMMAIVMVNVAYALGSRRG